MGVGGNAAGAQVVRRQLLRIVRVKEFSDEAQFVDPCRSVVLPNVICRFCNDCRDLDLCRDPLLLKRQWVCAVPHCHRPYDKYWIETALLQALRQRLQAYQLQDLLCTKCGQVSYSAFQYSKVQYDTAGKGTVRSSEVQKVQYSHHLSSHLAALFIASTQSYHRIPGLHSWSL